MIKKTRPPKDVYSPYCNEYYSKRSFYDELINKYRSLIAEVSILKEIISKNIELSKNWEHHTKSEQLHPQFSYPTLSSEKETLQDVIDRIKELKGFIEYKVDELKKIKARLESIKFGTDADNKDHLSDLEQNLQGSDLPYIDLESEWDFQGTLDMAEAYIAYSEAINDNYKEVEDNISASNFNNVNTDFSYDTLKEQFGLDAYRIDTTYHGIHNKPETYTSSPGSDLEKKDEE